MNLKEKHSSGSAKVSFIPLKTIVYLKNKQLTFFLESGISVYYNTSYLNLQILTKSKLL